MTTLNINGHDHSVDVPSDTPLLWVIREHLQMTGTKFGCGAGLCGACTVHLNGEAVRSCQTAVSQAAGHKITTIEGLDPKGEHPLAAGMDRRASSAVRLLPIRPDHAGRIAARQEQRSDQGRNRRAHGRQSVPLHDLRAHPARDSARRRRHAGSLSHDKASEDRRSPEPRPAQLHHRNRRHRARIRLRRPAGHQGRIGSSCRQFRAERLVRNRPRRQGARSPSARPIWASTSRAPWRNSSPRSSRRPGRTWPSRWPPTIRSTTIRYSAPRSPAAAGAPA